MREEWLIDGYNLLYFISASNDASRPLPSTKQALCAALAGFASSKKQKMLAVFDGVGQPDEMRVHEAPYFQAVYSQKVSADAHIEKYIFQNKASTAFWVVTDDRAISLIARGGGARVLKNSQFLEMLKESGAEGETRLFKEQVRAHGFNRPFDDQLKAKGL